MAVSVLTRDRVLTRPWSLSPFWISFTGLVLVCGIQLVLRLLVSPSVFADDADLLLFDQQLALGYSEQPPLYSWLVRLATVFLGRSVLTLSLVRSLILLAMGLIYFQCIRRLVRDERIALLGMFSLLLLPILAWYAVTYLTHTLLMCLLSLLTFLSLFRVVEKPSWFRHGELGLCLGLGMLSKYNFCLFAGAILISGLLIPSVRQRLLHFKILISLAMAVVDFLPHGLWLWVHWEEILHMYNQKFSSLESRFLLCGIPRGVVDLVVNFSLLLVPTIFLFFLGFPAAIKVIQRGAWRYNSCARWTFYYFLIVFFLHLALVLAKGMGKLHERWLEPYLILLPLGLFALLREVNLTLPQWRRGIIFIFLLCLFLTVARGGQLWWGGTLAGRNHMDYSFQKAGQVIRNQCSEGTILVTWDRGIAGNLLLENPNIPVLCLEQSAFSYRPKSPIRKTIQVWDGNGKSKLESYLIGFPQAAREQLSFCPKRLGKIQQIHIPSLFPGKPALDLFYTAWQD